MLSDKKGKTEKSVSAGEADGIRKGRFQSAMDPIFSKFNASISFDKRLYRQDVEGSVAHVQMLAAQGIISHEEGELIRQGLFEVLADIEQNKLEFREELEDVHINIEAALKKKIGDVAGKLHTARSRNDQIALDLRLYLRDRSMSVVRYLESLVEAFLVQAENNIDLILPGYTHLQRAQPVRLAHHLTAYCEMFLRDRERFAESLKRIMISPLGSAALAGTTFPIDRELVCDKLKFETPARNSMDAVSDRDFALEFLFNASVTMMHLSRLAEELIIWSSSEFNFCVLPDAYCSGSSIMPQKKNPDACELIRGKTGRVYGDLFALFTTLKALPLTYNKDLQEDKEPVFDAADTLDGALAIITGLISQVRFNGERMHEAASDPSLAATDLADKLVRQGKSFRDAHSEIGALMRADTESGTDFPTPEEMVEARNHVGGTARNRVLENIRLIRADIRGQNRER